MATPPADTKRDKAAGSPRATDDAAAWLAGLSAHRFGPARDTPWSGNETKVLSWTAERAAAVAAAAEMKAVAACRYAIVREKLGDRDPAAVLSAAALQKQLRAVELGDYGGLELAHPLVVAYRAAYDALAPKAKVLIYLQAEGHSSVWTAPPFGVTEAAPSAAETLAFARDLGVIGDLMLQFRAGSAADWWLA